jgi:hypothetical protein
MSPEFAPLQLTLVDRFVRLGVGTHVEGVHHLTNFQRRLGLGRRTSAAPESWRKGGEKLVQLHELFW